MIEQLDPTSEAAMEEDCAHDSFEVDSANQPVRCVDCGISMRTGALAKCTDAELLRLIAKDHERLAPNAYHSAETLRHIADRLVTDKNTLLPVAGQEDALREALFEVRCFLKSITNSDNEESFNALFYVGIVDKALAVPFTVDAIADVALSPMVLERDGGEQ